MEHVEYAYTYGMDESEVTEKLATEGTGVLSLTSSETDAYAVPMAHYYDGDGLYFRLGRTERSHKWECIERTETASYVVYGTESTDDPRELDSWSVVVTGHLRHVPESEYERFDTAEINRRFTPIRVFDEAIGDIDIVILELDVETMTGRTTSTQ